MTSDIQGKSAQCIRSIMEIEYYLYIFSFFEQIYIYI